MSINENGYPPTPGIKAAAERVTVALGASRPGEGRRGLIERLEAALDAADTLADAARELNDGPESKVVAAAIKRYRDAARGLDLRPLLKINPVV